MGLSKYKTVVLTQVSEKALEKVKEFSELYQSEQAVVIFDTGLKH